VNADEHEHRGTTATAAATVVLMRSQAGARSSRASSLAMSCTYSRPLRLNTSRIPVKTLRHP
jgi:hypothetical protein